MITLTLWIMVFEDGKLMHHCNEKTWVGDLLWRTTRTRENNIEKDHRC